MTISDSQKVDYLWKKIGYAATKTDTSSIKEGFNEAIPSPLQIRADKIMANAASIPGTIPGANTSVVAVFTTSAPVECTVDGTASTNRTWKTNLTDWISPEFGSTYQIKVYIHTAGAPGTAAASGTQVLAAGSNNNDEWFFDYQSGVLNFIGTNLPNGVSFSGKSVYVSGARYISTFGLPAAVNFGNIIFSGNTISSSQTNGNIVLIGNGNGIVQLGGNVAFGLPVGTDATRPANPEIGYIRFSTTQDSIEYWDGTQWLQPGEATIISDVLAVDGVSNTYPLSSNATAAGLMVSINGTTQQPLVAYTVVNNNQIQFNEVPLTSDVIEVRHIARTATAATYTNADVAAYLPTYYGNIGNVNIQTLNNVAAIISITGNVTTLEANAAYQAGILATLLANAATQAGDLTTIFANLGAVSGNVNTLFSNAGAQASDITSLYSNAAIQAGNIATIFANLGATSGTLANITANLAAVSGNTATIFANLGAVSGSLATLTANAGAQAGSITTLTANAAVQSGDIATLYANAAAQAGILANLTYYANTNVAAYLTTYTGSISTLSITNALSVTNDLTVGGNIFVNGNVTLISSNNLVVNDNIVYFANANPGNSLDIGWVGQFISPTRQYTGLVRQATSGQWKLFSNITTEPGSTINFTNAVYDPIQTGNITSPTITDIYANLGAVSGSLTILTSNAAVQAGNIATLFSNAAVQAGNIAVLQSNVTTIFANISATAGNVATIFANLGSVSGDLATLYANAALQAGNIASLTAAVESGFVTTYETVAKNLNAYPYALNRSGTLLTSVTYTSPGGTITKEFTYTGSLVSSIAIYGGTLGYVYTKNLSYSGTSLTGASYSVL